MYEDKTQKYDPENLMHDTPFPLPLSFIAIVQTIAQL